MRLRDIISFYAHVFGTAFAVGMACLLSIYIGGLLCFVFVWLAVSHLAARMGSPLDALTWGQFFGGGAVGAVALALVAWIGWVTKTLREL